MRHLYLGCDHSRALAARAHRPSLVPCLMALVLPLDPWRALVVLVGLQFLLVRDLLHILRINTNTNTHIHTNLLPRDSPLNRFLSKPCLGGPITYVFPQRHLLCRIVP